MPFLGALAPLLGSVILPAAAIVGGTIAGQRLGTQTKAKMENLYDATRNQPAATTSAAPAVPGPATSSAPTASTPVIDTAAAATRAQKRRTQAEDLSLFSLNSGSSTQNNSLLGL